MCCRADFNSGCAHLPLFLSNAIVERDSSDIFLTTSFIICNIRNTNAMRVIFFFNMLNIVSKFRKCRKNWEKFFSFLDNCICIGCVNLSQLRREYLSSEVIVLTNGPFFSSVSLTLINKYDKVLPSRSQQHLI